MSLTGIIGGVWKMIEGVIEEDGDKVAEGVTKTVKSTVSTVVSTVTGEIIEIIHNDDDHDD